MIQRIQSLWLILAALLNALLFFIPLYQYNFPNQIYSPWQVERVSTYIPLFVVAALIVLLPFVAIFLFKNRKKQKNLIWLSLLANVVFLAIVFMRVADLKNATPPPGNFSYAFPGVLLTIISCAFLILSIRGIRHDEKLIRSMDRLR